MVGEAPDPGSEVVAAFRPHAVSVYVAPPAGSPRNALGVIVVDVHPAGDLIRVRAEGPGGLVLSADVTAPAAAELALAPGLRVVFSVKATEVSVYRV